MKIPITASPPISSASAVSCSGGVGSGKAGINASVRTSPNAILMRAGICVSPKPGSSNTAVPIRAKASAANWTQPVRKSGRARPSN